MVCLSLSALSRSYSHQKSGHKNVLMTHNLVEKVLYFSSAVSCLCLTLVLWGPMRHRKGHFRPQNFLAVTCSWPEVPHFFSSTACLKVVQWRHWYFKHFLTACGYFKLALCAGNNSKVTSGCLLEHCLVHATCLAKCCWQDPPCPCWRHQVMQAPFCRGGAM